MKDKQPIQADGKGEHAETDGVRDPATEGESSGGAYPNPHTGESRGGFAGGQSGRGHEGPDTPNATTRPD